MRNILALSGGLIGLVALAILMLQFPIIGLAITFLVLPTILFLLFMFFPHKGGAQYTQALPIEGKQAELEKNTETQDTCIRALQSLGFNKAASAVKIKDILKDNPDYSVEEVIKIALRKK